MKARIERMGNSHIIRLPKSLLELTGLRGEVEIVAAGKSPIVRPLRKARAGWAEAFRRMADCGDDTLHDVTTFSLSSRDEEEWEW